MESRLNTLEKWASEQGML